MVDACLHAQYVLCMYVCMYSQVCQSRICKWLDFNNRSIRSFDFISKDMGVNECLASKGLDGGCEYAVVSILGRREGNEWMNGRGVYGV